MKRLLTGFGATVVFLSLCATPALAAPGSDVSAGRFESLASRAIHDAGALRRFRSITSVDGYPVDVPSLLSGVSGAQLDARLRALSRSSGSSSIDPVTARRAASKVLSQPRFHASMPPRPLGGIFDRLGRALADPVGWVERFLQRLSLHIPGGSRVLWIIGIGLILLIVFLIGFRLISRRTKALGASPTLYGVTIADPDDLERQARRAEDEGRFSDALRLLYVAGILRLHHAGVISLNDSLTTHQIEVQVDSATFSEITRSFERIAYGRRDANEFDLSRARAAWGELLQRAAA